MKGLPRALLSMLAGIVTATALFALSWRMVGIHCQRYWDYSTPPLYFWGTLMPEMIGIAIVSGMVTGLFRVEGRLARPSLRAVITAFFFSLGVFVYVVLLLPGRFTIGVAEHSSILAHIGLALASVVLALFSTAIGASPFIVVSAAGAGIGERLLRAKKLTRSLVVAISFIVVLVYIFYHGALVQVPIRQFKASLPQIKSVIRKNLIAVSDNIQWTPRVYMVNPTAVRGIRLILPNGSLYVGTTPTGKIKDVFLRIVTAEGKLPESKEAARAFLLKQGLREPVLVNLHQTRSGEWESKYGLYDVILTDNKPSYD